MDRWLGDGGMPIIALVGAALTGYGVDGEELGWVAGSFVPTDWPATRRVSLRPGSTRSSSTPSMNFAINAALPRVPDPGHARDEDRVHASRPQG